MVLAIVVFMVPVVLVALIILGVCYGSFIMVPVVLIVLIILGVFYVSFIMVTVVLRALNHVAFN